MIIISFFIVSRPTLKRMRFYGDLRCGRAPSGVVDMNPLWHTHTHTRVLFVFIFICVDGSYFPLRGGYTKWILFFLWTPDWILLFSCNVFFSLLFYFLIFFMSIWGRSSRTCLSVLKGQLQHPSFLYFFLFLKIYFVQSLAGGHNNFTICLYLSLGTTWSFYFFYFYFFVEEETAKSRGT